ncbi:hypothetical protein SAMN02910353_02831 [Ruminococcus sp. YRD2003]|uniref:hypothetical protein n=1 Tax=Ruminococcus sp. YRD2003 TaxID=1452313 RepID=UPI0008AF0718|nr:hypothetical protein SAMN02910353_02831 [Ruminococcus flavefaciens]
MNAVEDIQKAVIADGQIQLGFSTNDEETDLYNYEMVSGEFFAQIKEPAFTINVNKVYVNTAAVRLLPKVDHVKFMINRDEKKLVIKPCSDMDIQGYNWAKEKEGKRYPSHRTGEPFVQSLCMLMNWNPQFRYKISGKKNRAKGDGEEILVFDLTSFKCFEKEISEDGKISKRPVFPPGWNGTFGPKYGESNRTLQVNTFDGYTVFSLKGKENTAETSAASSNETASPQMTEGQENVLE